VSAPFYNTTIFRLIFAERASGGSMADSMQTTTASPIRGTTAPVPPVGRPQDPAAGILGDAKGIGTGLASAVRDSATALFEDQRNRAADEIAALGETLRRSVQSLDNTNGTVARYADQASRQIGDFATTLRQRSWNEMTGDVENFARRWPLAFIAATVGVGFAAGRFLMASAARPAEAARGVGDAGLPSSTSPAARPAAGATGTVSGPVSGTGRSGYGATSGREIG
jgi:hypothetical protein